MTKLEDVASAVCLKISPHRNGCGCQQECKIRGRSGIMQSIARAAIEAMREPSEVMSGQAQYELHKYERGYDDAKPMAVKVWQAMIDAALAEKP